MKDFFFDSRLDGHLLLELYDDDSDHALMAFNDFLKMSPGLMGELDEQFSKGSVEIFRQKMHKLKPIFSYVGLPGMSQKAEVIEKKCKEVAAINELGVLYSDLKKNFDETYAIVKQEANRLSAM